MKKGISVLLLAGILLSGCGRISDILQDGISTEKTGKTAEETGSGENRADSGNAEKAENDASGMESSENSAESGNAGNADQAGNMADNESNTGSTDVTDDTEILNFVDVYGEAYQTIINSDVEKHTYDRNAFSRTGNAVSYIGDTRYTSRLGIDVSHHQGSINWEKVKQAGFDFAFIRLGYRGYGQDGNVCLDRQFFQNMKDAGAAGIDTGVYFFSQAINEDEAVEEAEFVLEQIKDFELQLPIVYDPESILDVEARTDNVTGEQFTKNTIVFCEKIKAAGYQPMIYSNMLWEAFEYDLEQLSEYPIWYADYEPLPQTPYHFEYWQYTNTAVIDGVDGTVDLDVQLIPVN